MTRNEALQARTKHHHSALRSNRNMMMATRSLRTLPLRHATRLAAVRAPRALSTVGIFKDKEAAEENIFFAKEEKVLLDKYAKKVKSAAEEKRQLKMEIQALVGPERKLPDDVVDRLADMITHK
mmetsp:Transcript_1829/g.7076  ORF Transcript_1829/g.7076 Transcript_1829/m.7076 type:complete len:124 (+) Transcript_1829:51-422(+)